MKRLALFLMNHKWISLSLLGAATFVILYLTLAPPDQLGDHQIYSYDKIGHFMMFFGWTALFGIFSFSIKGPARTKIIPIFFLGALFGIGIELIQGWMPYGRVPSVYDAIADIFGSLTAAILLKWLKSGLS
jgi:VanZ family protein